MVLICKYNELNNTIIMPKNDEYDLLYLKQTGITFAKQYFSTISGAILLV
jgi:hypothetical protein